ncbi:MAG: gliding motility-associated C-terminal domain-containing protein, partial [Flavobacteriaceae bacterium]|nr:gliding motility-associated C-terminal domain-containing protein [Flavobacteriaceae bacterium]
SRDAYTNDVFFNVNLNVNRSGNATQTGNTGLYMSLIGPDGASVPLNNPSIFGGRIVTNNGRYLSLERSGYTYRFRNLPSGRYALTVEENVDGTGLTPCTEIFFFTVREYLPIQYNGQTVFVTDLCEGIVVGGIRASATGGSPFIVDDIPTYQFEWTFTPNDPTQASQVFYGEVIDRALPGSYCLRILDQNGHSYCSCDTNEPNPVTIEVQDVVTPFSTEGTLSDPDQLGVLFKSLPPECSSGGFNGKIGVQVIGGQLPYTIKWFAEDPRELVNGNGYRELTQYQNSTSLQNLLPGNYKMLITSTINTCPSPNQYTIYEEIIQVSPNRELYIMEGPFVDEDLCTGEQGRLIVEIFDNNNGNLSFYYNDILIPASDVVRLNDRSWSIAIVNAIETADFRIVNDEGCWITTPISRGIGEPNFRYTSPNFAASSIILAREEITFENTSTDPYVSSEWIFGDNSTPQIVPTLYDSIIPVRHAYGVSGTYFTTLRLYNDIGCSEEITLPISVGKGYNIMVPNVFTPNNDLVNDNFRPLFSGFSNMTFTVYDYRGNVVYNEYAEEADLNNIQGISITGWDGSLAPYSPYFIYTAFGVLLDGETEVEKSGTFIVIN